MKRRFIVTTTSLVETRANGDALAAALRAVEQDRVGAAVKVEEDDGHVIEYVPLVAVHVSVEPFSEEEDKEEG